MVAVMGGSLAALRADPARLDDVFGTLRARVAEGVIPSAALAVGDAAGQIRAEAFGPGGRTLDPDTNFFLASITKPIFATAFMQLVEDGVVGLREPIKRWFPEFADGEKAEITPWHLLTHTSGVSDFAPEDIIRRRPSAAQMTQHVTEAQLRFTPGTRYEYCSASFYLLARIIEVEIGLGYARFLRERVTEPLGIGLTFDPRRAGRPIVAVHGAGVDNRFIRFMVLRYMAGAALPGGGLFGSLADLARYGAALLEPVRAGDRAALPLRRETFNDMTRDQLGGLPGVYDGEERSIHFGLGWGKPTLMRDWPGSDSTVSHGGATGGRLWIDPEPGLVLAFLTNRWSADRGPEVEAISGVYEALEG
ncbi:MAG: serine hydrolase domain-containing protein [Chloroflexota bacterium]